MIDMKNKIAIIFSLMILLVGISFIGSALAISEIVIGDYKNSLGAENVESLCGGNGISLRVAGFDFVEVLRKAIEFLQGPGGPLKDSAKIKIAEEE